MATTFLTKDWAAQVKDAVNTTRSQEYQATKLDLYWNWVDQVGAQVDGTLALGVLGRPGEANGAGDRRYLALGFEAGRCTAAAIVDEAEASGSRWVLEGRYEDWQALMNGYDTNKAIMYRKLRLAHGDVYDFFNRVYFFIEALVNLAKVPTSFDAA